MSLLASILLLAQATAPASTAAEAAPHDTITVVAERMRSIEVNVGRSREGEWHCSLSSSTGSTWVDDRLCRLTTGCVRDAQADHERAERCIQRRRARLIDEFRKALDEGRA